MDPEDDTHHEYDFEDQPDEFSEYDFDYDIPDDQGEEDEE